MARAIDGGSLGSHSNAAPPGDLGHGADVRGHDRAAARHRLEDGKAERLVERRVDEHLRGLVEAGGLLERDAADEDDVLGDTELCRQACSSAVYFSSRPCPTMTSCRPGSSPRACTQALSNPSQFLYRHSDDTNRTNGLVTPYLTTCACAAKQSPGLKSSWSTAS